jgi:crotonobetainyl-CoA:carnitine CoA-transferase CaiB-like acyl-CoA transferase
VDTQEAFATSAATSAAVVRLAQMPGAEGLLADDVLPDFALAAIGGLTYITGDPHESPRTPRDLIATRLAGLYAACVACSLLIRPAPKVVVEIYIREVIASCLESTMPIWFVEHRPLQRATNMHDIAWPVATYKTIDGWVGISCGRLEDTRRLLSLLGLDQLVAPTVTTFAEIPGIEALDAQLARRLGELESHSLVKRCQSQRVAAGVAMRPLHILDDEQAVARDFIAWWPRGTPVLRSPITEHDKRRPDPRPPRRLQRGNVWQRKPEGWDGIGPMLSGFRVLDLTWALAGPFATMILADLGADVAKVESHAHLDSSRLVGPYLGFEDIERSGYFRFFNRNKRSLECDIGDAAGRNQILALAGNAHAVVENFRPGSLDAKGLGYGSLISRQSQLAMCSISGFGRQGPRSSWASYGGAMAECVSGLAMATGGTKPIVPARALSDIFTGLYAALAICAQLFQQTHQNLGSYTEVTQFEAVASALEELLVLEPEPSEAHRIVGSDEQGWWAEGSMGKWPVVDAGSLARALESAGATDRIATAEGEDVFLRPPLTLGGERLEIRLRSPRIGEHTGEVIREWLGN